MVRSQPLDFFQAQADESPPRQALHMPHTQLYFLTKSCLPSFSPVPEWTRPFTTA